MRLNDNSERGGRVPAEQPARYFPPTNFSVANRTSVAALILIIAGLGFLSYTSIPKESSPEITIPMIAVSTIYPGVAPKDMETLVTRVIEEELNKVPEITALTSTSDMGYSSVVAEFDSDMNMDEALQKVREKVDLAKPSCLRMQRIRSSRNSTSPTSRSCRSTYRESTTQSGSRTWPRTCRIASNRVRRSSKSG
jgi:multidrug efflux pump subunit AcrB